MDLLKNMVRKVLKSEEKLLGYDASMFCMGMGGAYGGVSCAL